VRKEKSWEEEPGHCILPIEIEFESTGYKIDTNYMAHPEFQRPPEGEELRIIIAVKVNGTVVPQEELNRIQVVAPTFWEEIFDVIDKAKLEKDN